MNEAEFDRFAEEYYQDLAASVAVSGEQPEFFAAYKIEDLASRVARSGVHASTILDFGSGIGSSVPHFRRLFPDADVICADVSSKSLEISASRFPGSERYLKLGGDTIPLDSGSVDVAFSSCVFHHIPQCEHHKWLVELRRVVRPGGMLMVVEHNPYNPVTVRTVRDCPFDENAVLMTAKTLRQRFLEAGWSSVDSSYRLFFPRALAWLRPSERFMSWLPFGAQYHVAGWNIEE
ncbi:MAG: SAM-dependent methyltransferase [Gammaproteobacteria bacterium]|nr:SAM-dependent methyltransferase [Gammaproteobacteria bacterium]